MPRWFALHSIDGGAHLQAFTDQVGAGLEGVIPGLEDRELYIESSPRTATLNLKSRR